MYLILFNMYKNDFKKILNIKKKDCSFFVSMCFYWYTWTVSRDFHLFENLLKISIIKLNKLISMAGWLDGIKLYMPKQADLVYTYIIMLFANTKNPSELFGCAQWKKINNRDDDDSWTTLTFSSSGGRLFGSRYQYHTQ